MPVAGTGTHREHVTNTNQKIKILLVDDTPENLISLEAALDGLGEELVLARSGKEALLHLLEHDFAAILLDVKMPDMDGFETANLIRSRPRSRHTPILFLTGYRNDEHLFRGYDLGAVDFLFKPIVPEILRSKVAVFIELSRQSTTLQEQTNVLRRQTEVLHKAEQKFRQLLEAAPDAMVICREDGTILMVNSRTESLFDYERTSLMGKHIALLVPGWSFELLPAPDEDLSKAVLRPLNSGQEVFGRRHDGTSFPADLSVSPLQTDDGFFITSALRDISERKKIEEQIRELNAHLEERILVRTEALLRSNEELQQFAYVASHDLQEPLRTISIYTQLLAKKYGREMDAEAECIFGTIVESSQRMEQLIEDLLDFSKIDSRSSDFFKLTDCEQLLNQVIRDLQTRIQETQATITCGPLPSVVGDPIQLTRLFQNLLTNSLKYRSDEPPRIHVSACAKGTEWTFSVRDNGIGIEPQYADKVFGIFKRLHGREKYSGNGMGLAICKKIVERHGGRIWVDPNCPEGTCIWFTLHERL